MKKLIAVLLSLCLIAAMVPMAALADEAAPETEAASSSWYNRDNWSYDEAMNAWYYNGIPYVELTDDAPEWVVERWFGEDDYWHGGWHDGWHDGWWGEHKPVAYVGDQWYWDFGKALEAAGTNGTVTLTGTVYEDVTLEDVIVTGSYRWGGAFSGDVTTKGIVNLENLTVYGKIKVDSGKTVADNVSLEETVGVDVTIDEGVTCGPRAYLRGGAHVLAGAHVGTHVEIKNSTIGRGSKVPHLSYIGDCTMGSGVNIGGGSITCNYDGVHKNRTVIGNDVFVGSDTMMVAPVTIGDGALVGASSCVTKDVPADALYLERAEQRIVEGYASRRLERLKRSED